MFRKIVGVLPALIILGVIAVIVYFMLYKNKIPDAPPSSQVTEETKEELKAPAPPTTTPAPTPTTTETSGKGAGGTAVPKA